MSQICSMVVAGIFMVGIGGYLIYYGVKGGLIEKNILINCWRNSYATGRKAVRQGIFYIAIGVGRLGKPHHIAQQNSKDVGL